MSNIFDLYEDLPPTKQSGGPTVAQNSTNLPGEPKKHTLDSEWSAEAKLLGAQMKRKQVQQNSAKNQKPTPKGKPAVVNSMSTPKPVVQPTKQQPIISKNEMEPIPMNLEDEDDVYDPARPNDYEKILQERRQQEKRDFEEFEPFEPMEVTNSPPKQRMPEPIPIPEEPKVEDETEEDREAKKQKVDAPKGLNPAVAKMMAKMGYREGQGLGRASQGIVTPLEAKKNRTGGAVIVGGEVAPKKAKSYPESSKVLILTNMIGRGEVDDDLQSEIEEEARKYGPIQKVVIFQDHSFTIPEEEAVRIYVSFSNGDDAYEARVALHGRSFAGRTVVARFFDEELFNEKDFQYFPPS